MSETFITSDTHFMHRAEFLWKPMGFSSIEEHDEVLIQNWNADVKPQDTVIHAGDVCFQPTISIDKILPRLNGKKILVMGNHDSNKKLLNYFDKVVASLEWGRHGSDSEFVISHIPIHPCQLTGRWTKAKNLHGHLHHVEDLGERYINVNIQFWNNKLINIQELRNNK